MDPHDSVYIWMTLSHMRLCCSAIHKSNPGKPISRLSGVQSDSYCSSFSEILLITDLENMMAHPGSEACASGGVFIASNAGRSGGSCGSIRSQLRERCFRNFKQCFYSFSHLVLVVLCCLYLFHLFHW